MMRRVITNVLGVLAIMFLIFHWIVLLNPLKWDLSFPGGIRGALLTMLMAMLASLAGASGEIVFGWSWRPQMY